MLGIPTANLYLKVVPRWNGIAFERKHQDSKGDLCIWCGDHWRNTPLKTQHGQGMCKPRRDFNFMILQYPTVAVETFNALRFVIRLSIISYSLELSSCICAIRYKPVLETTTSSANANQAKEAPRFIQPSEFANLPSDIANSSVELYNPGPSTHGCRTPENM